MRRCPPPVRAGLAAFGSLAAVALVASGCSSSGSGGSDNPVISPPPVSSTTTSTPVTPPASSSTVVSTPVAPPSSPSSSPASSSTPPPATSTAPAGPATCTAQQLSLLVVRGGATPQQELAQVVFTNTSSKTCSLSGYPSVQLLHNGAALGSPATHGSGQVRVVPLAPKGSAEADITATTDCNAALSDNARIAAPGIGAADAAVKPLKLRACVLRVTTVQAAS